MNVFASGLLCRHVFVHETPYHGKAYEEVLSILRTLPTDHQSIYSTYANNSLAYFLKITLHRQERQLALLKEAQLPGISAHIKNYYIEQLTTTINNSRRTFNEMKETLDLEHLTLRILERSPLMFGTIPERVRSFIFPTNAVLSELLTAINYKRVIDVESPLPTMMRDHWPRVLAHLEKNLSPEQLESALVKQMDLHAIQDGVHHFVEVKYFGSIKDYSHASGKSVFTKLQHVKIAAEQLPYPTQVTLAIVGPGRLEPTAFDSYTKNGVRVIYITPNW